jgi:hypothetical protein
MNYHVKIIYQIVGAEVQFQESYMAINASSQYDAYIKALHIGCNSQKKLATENGNILRWHFVNVIDLKPRFKGETNYIYNRLLKPENAQKYLALMQNKASQLALLFSHR